MVGQLANAVSYSWSITFINWAALDLSRRICVEDQFHSTAWKQHVRTLPQAPGLLESSSMLHPRPPESSLPGYSRILLWDSCHFRGHISNPTPSNQQPPGNSRVLQAQSSGCASFPGLHLHLHSWRLATRGNDGHQKAAATIKEQQKPALIRDQQRLVWPCSHLHL